MNAIRKAQRSKEYAGIKVGQALLAEQRPSGCRFCYQSPVPYKTEPSFAFLCLLSVDKCRESLDPLRYLMYYSYFSMA